MRKLYVLLAVLSSALMSSQSHARTFSPDVANFTFTIEPATNNVTFTNTSTTLGKYFVAQPQHSQNKKPVRICWTFGDNDDTCIQYSTTYTGAYGVYHLYGQPGAYNVCVKILYDGGCEAHECHVIQTGEA